MATGLTEFGYSQHITYLPKKGNLSKKKREALKKREISFSWGHQKKALAQRGKVKTNLKHRESER